jgi:microcystin-dependent protein
MADPFIGEIRIFAGTYAPVGWNFCDGSLLAISTNDTLYALIGTTYGGDGQQTFAVPDLRGRVPIHWGSGPDQPVYPLGQRAGVNDVTLDADELPSHSHVLMAAPEVGTKTEPTGQTFAKTGTHIYSDKLGLPFNPMSGSAIGPAGGSGAHNNMMPYQAINYIIALQGVFPQQN